jgi:hypothetical protein
MRRPDITRWAKSAGGSLPALTRYAVTGKYKGRVAAPDVDEARYAATYPLVNEDLHAGRAATISEHYFD